MQSNVQMLHTIFGRNTGVSLHTFETVLHDFLSEEQVTVYILLLSSKTVPHCTYTSPNDL